MRPNATLFHRIRWYLIFQVQAIFCAAVVVPFFILVTTCAFITRLFVWIIASLFRRDLKEMYSDNGITFAMERVDVKPKCTILSTLIFQKPLLIDVIRQNFEKNILNCRDSRGFAPYAHLKDYWAPFLNFYFWKEDKSFELSNHLRTYDYDDPDLYLPIGSMCTVEDLERVTGSLLCQPFPAERSPWEMLLVPNYKSAEGNDGCAVVFRIHHTLSDGYSTMALTMKLFEAKVETPKVNFQKVNLFLRLAQIITIILRLPWDLATNIFHFGNAANQWNLDGKKLARKYFAYFSDPIPVSRLKMICKTFGVTYNALVYSIGCGVAVRMMKEAGHQVPKKLSIDIPLPLPSHPGGLVNHMMFTWFVIYPCDTDPLQRLRHVSSQLKPANIFVPQAEMLYYMGRTAAYFPIYFVKAFMASQPQVLGMSSFRGLLEPVQTVASNKFIDNFGAVGRPVGLQGGVSFHMQSCAGKQHINVIVDKAILSNKRFPFKFKQYIEDEINALVSSQDLC